MSELHKWCYGMDCLGVMSRNCLKAPQGCQVQESTNYDGQDIASSPVERSRFIDDCQWFDDCAGRRNAVSCVGSRQGALAGLLMMMFAT